MTTYGMAYPVRNACIIEFRHSDFLDVKPLLLNSEQIEQFPTDQLNHQLRDTIV